MMVGGNEVCCTQVCGTMKLAVLFVKNPQLKNHTQKKSKIYKAADCERQSVDWPVLLSAFRTLDQN